MRAQFILHNWLAGGYYAARLALLERLAEMRWQASVLMMRETTEKRWEPLGIWVVREAAREALRNPAKKFETLEKVLADMATRIRTPSRDWSSHSELVRGVGQTTLAKFF